jgi:hypothetical protein
MAICNCFHYFPESLFPVQQTCPVMASIYTQLRPQHISICYTTTSIGNKSIIESILNTLYSCTAIWNYHQLAVGKLFVHSSKLSQAKILEYIVFILYFCCEHTSLIECVYRSIHLKSYYYYQSVYYLVVPKQDLIPWAGNLNPPKMYLSTKFGRKFWYKTHKSFMWALILNTSTCVANYYVWVTVSMD